MGKTTSKFLNKTVVFYSIRSIAQHQVTPCVALNCYYCYWFDVTFLADICDQTCPGYEAVGNSALGVGLCYIPLAVLGHKLVL